MFRSSGGSSSASGGNGVVWLGLPGNALKEEQRQGQGQQGDPFASKLGGRPVRVCGGVWGVIDRLVA